VVQRRGGKQGGSRGPGASSVTPTFANGDHRHQHHLFYDQRPHRSSPRTRSVSHSSPIFYSGGGSGDNYRQHFNNVQTSDKHKHSSSAKQQQHQKKNKKTSTVCKQKLDFDSSGDNGIASAVSPKGNVAAAQQLANNQPKAPMAAGNTSILETSTPVFGNVDIKPSQVWQQFQFNWEPILSGM